MVENAVKEVYMAHHPKTMIIADLGCCAGPNTFLFISSVIDIIADQTKCTGDDPVELQFFLNDLPSNDFNELFRSIQTFKRSVATRKYTIAGFSLVKVSTYSTLNIAFIGALRYFNHFLQQIVY